MSAPFLPYCLPDLGDEEIAEVAASLKSGWVTTGPKAKEFEERFAASVRASHAVAVNSCTAGLILALEALGIGPGDEVVVPTMTFCASVNAIVHRGATPVLVDCGEDLQPDPAKFVDAISPRTRALLPVHFGGGACDLGAILGAARARGLGVVEDAAHATGTFFDGEPIGADRLGEGLRRVTVFSFYATKNLSTGEGGMAVTADADLAERMRVMSLHGMDRDAWKRYSAAGNWEYDVIDCGYKANMTDLQAAIGLHQLAKLERFQARREAIAARYREAFSALRGVSIVPGARESRHAHHLFILRIAEGSRISRDAFIARMKEEGIGTSVHFIPVHRFSFHRRKFNLDPADFPVAERMRSEIVSLPLYPRMSDTEVDRVIGAVRRLLA